MCLVPSSRGVLGRGRGRGGRGELLRVAVPGVAVRGERERGRPPLHPRLLRRLLRPLLRPGRLRGHRRLRRPCPPPLHARPSVPFLCPTHINFTLPFQQVGSPTCELSETRVRCGPEAASKAGTCPAMEEGFCLNECETDTDCLGDRKCCSNACGSRCLRPGLTSPSVLLSVSGQSTPQIESTHCSPCLRTHGDSTALLLGSLPINSHLSLPSEGAEGAAVEPGGKLGECPAAVATTSCTSECTRDGDCPGVQKCCGNGCAQLCVFPHRTTGPHSPPSSSVGLA